MSEALTPGNEPNLANAELVEKALSDRVGFENWLNSLPNEGIHGEVVTRYLVEATGLLPRDVSWVSRPAYLNKFDENLNQIVEVSPRNFVPGRGEISQIEEHGFTKQEILDAYYRANPEL